MPAQPYEYAIVRVVPDVERGECLNLGVIVHAPEVDHLACRIEMPRACLAAMAPALDLGTLRRHLDGVRWVCGGDPRGNPVAALPLRERFHWLVHPRSAILVVSEVHAGLSDDLGATLDLLFERLVARR
ncbi:MAG: DUF3037 domain-containing protein [Nannocystaceae bacterium]|nr:DUF3037 domain-containing protein [bacterium]